MRLWLNIGPTFWLDKKIHFYRLKYALANFTNEKNSIEILHFDNSKCLMAHFSYVANRLYFSLGHRLVGMIVNLLDNNNFSFQPKKGQKKI